MIGTCRFCGQLREVNAPDQGRADEKASRTCDCAGAEHYARKIAATEAVETICEGYAMDQEQITVLQAIALAVDDGAITKANMTMNGLSVKVGSKSNGNTFVKIVRKQEDDREITRNGVR
jgi:hypothetical protein